jgi:hypothetical protein
MPLAVRDARGLALVFIPPPRAGDRIAEAPALTVVEWTTQPLLWVDRPWEGFCLSYITVLRVGSRWQFWYTAHDEKSRTDAESGPDTGSDTSLPADTL